MTWNEITALAGVGMVIAAFGAVGVAYRAFKSQELSFHNSSETYRLSVSADLVTRLEEKFDGSLLRRPRHSATKALLENQNLGDAENIFDFFETFGLYWRLGVLNKEMVHSTFFHWINAYWIAGHDYIVKTRQGRSSTIWVDFQAIYEATRAVEGEKPPLSEDLNPPKLVVTSYLKEELETCSDQIC